MITIKKWFEGISDSEAKDVAYWERNVLALKYAQGWYRDIKNDYPGFSRVLSIDDGRIAFHIPDDFNVGNLQEIPPNWDGSTTEEKWRRILRERGLI